MIYTFFASWFDRSGGLEVYVSSTGGGWELDGKSVMAVTKLWSHDSRNNIVGEKQGAGGNAIYSLTDCQ